MIRISRKLVKQIEDIFPESCHITTVLSDNTDDREIWQYAKDNGFVIVTKDDDFEQRSVLLGHPPKVVWIRLGNCKTSEILALIRNSQIPTNAFANDEEKSTLPLP